MIDYNIKRTFMINNKNVNVFFKDNESQPLFHLKDVLGIMKCDFKRPNTSNQVSKIPEEHKNKVFSDHKEHWVIDLEGVKTILKEQTDEDTVNNIIDQIKKQVDDEIASIPSSIVSTKCEESLAPVETIKFIGTKIHYMYLEDTAVCLIDDFRKIYNNDIVANSLKAVKEYEIRKYSTSLGINQWITTGGLMDLFQSIDQERALNNYEEIIRQIVANEKISGTWEIDAVLPTKIIDGELTDSSRYQKFSVEDVSCIAYNNGSEVLVMYNIKDICRQRGLNIEMAKKAATRHCTFIFFGKEIFVTLHGINQIMKHMRNKNFNYIKDLAKKSKNVTDKMIWNIKGEEVSAMRHELEIKEIDTMEPAEVKGTDFIVFKAENLKIQDSKYCWILLAKSKNDLEGPTFPLFVVRDLEEIFQFQRIRDRMKSVSKNCKGHVSIKGVHKPNALVLNIPGLKELAADIGASQTLVEKLINTAYKWIEDNEEDTQFAVLMEKTHENVKKETGERTMEEQTKEQMKATEEIEGAALHAFTVNYKKQQISAIITISDNHIIPYFEKQSLAKIAKLNDTPESIIDNKAYISLQNLSSAIDSKTAEEIFNLIKPEYQKFTTKITTTKKREQNDMLYDYLGSQNTELFILGAIMLAEHLRSVTLWIKINSKNRKISGPSTNIILNELWKHIYCQDHKAPVSFGFRRIVTAATARYESLMEISRFLRKDEQR